MFDLRFMVIADRYTDILHGDKSEEEIYQKFMKKREAKAWKKNIDASGSDFFPDRSIDQLKDRYYKVCKLILESRGDVEHPIVKRPFIMEQEIRRKTNLEKLFMRTKE